MNVKVQSMNFNNKINYLINQYFDGNSNDFHNWLIDTYNIDIGTGNYLSGQPVDDIESQEGNSDFAPNITDEKLSQRALTKYSSCWFIYSSNNSIARLLTINDIKVLSKALHNTESQYNYYDFVSDETKAKKQLQQLV